MDIKALVTDSSSKSRSNLSRSLKEIGIRNVVEATDGPQAMEMLKKDKYDIVAFAKDASPAEMATLAADLVGHRDDPVARELLREGADWILRAVQTLGRERGERLCLLGGLGPHYAPLLGVKVSAPEGTALDGALALAAEVP